MTVFTVLGLTAGVAAGLCFYTASPNQRLLTTPWPRRRAHGAGVLLLALAGLALAQDLQRLTTVFVLGTVLMLVLTVLPHAGALRHARRR